MPSLTPVDESFFSRAPQLFEHTWTIDRSADSVWGELTGEHPLHWVNGLNIRWTSARPFGVGATRTATVFGLVKVQEHFFRWEDDPAGPRRHTFFGAAMNIPLFQTLAEDYIVEPRGDDACAFTWKIAIEPSTLGKPGASLNGLLFGQAFRDTGKYFRARGVGSSGSRS